MILGNQAIQEAINAGHIVCDPAPEAINDAHIDVRLGRYVWYPRLAPHWDETAAIRLHDADPLDYYDLVEHNGAVEIELPPRGFVLGVTLERVGTTVPWLEPNLNTRSSLARWGVQAHLSAGHGDPGFCGIWTLEIANHWHRPIHLHVGMRIASVSFETVHDQDALYTGRYDPAQWTPQAMLPRRGNW